MQKKTWIDPRTKGSHFRTKQVQRPHCLAESTVSYRADITTSGKWIKFSYLGYRVLKWERNDLSSVANLSTCFYITFSPTAMPGVAENCLKPFWGAGLRSAWAGRSSWNSSLLPNFCLAEPHADTAQSASSYLGSSSTEQTPLLLNSTSKISQNELCMILCSLAVPQIDRQSWNGRKKGRWVE